MDYSFFMGIVRLRPQPSTRISIRFGLRRKVCSLFCAVVPEDGEIKSYLDPFEYFLGVKSSIRRYQLSSQKKYIPAYRLHIQVKEMLIVAGKHNRLALTDKFK